MPDPQPELRAIFCEALDRPSPREQAEYLDQACRGRPALRARVEALLQANAEASDFLQETSDRGAALVVEAGGRERPGTRLGPYQLLEPIGEGGMGAVWLAEQTEPVCRKVALKIIKPGMDSKPILARFEVERQALALMDHPNIAKVLDAGTTEASDEPERVTASARPDSDTGRDSGDPSRVDTRWLASGRPYFVMELVKGVPITTFCDQNRLTLRQRLELFVPVCHAIQHAHTKSIIHRDIKPSNVLVACYDGVPVPKVIDFGIAKAMDQRLTEQTLVTGIGQVIGTLEYMSPEQAEFNAQDIDTRSDVYSLGVLLYELLTGTTPLGGLRLHPAHVLELLRRIREEEPPKPSTQLCDSETLPDIAAARKTEPAQLTRTVRGELDWIVMKALEKDRNRRYESATNLAADVGRYLRDEPVEACPPSAAYRLRKFVRRHRGPVLAAATILLLLVAGVAVSTWQAVRATVAEGSERKAREQAELDRDAKEQERKYAQGIADFVKDDFLALTSVEGQVRFGGSTEGRLDKDATLRQLLDRAAEKLNRRDDLDPRTEAELRWMIGVNYRGLGEAGLAIPFLERCAALRNELLGPDHEDTLQAQNSLAVAYQAAGKVGLALPLFDKTLTIEKATHGTDHPKTLHSMDNLAKAYQAAGQLALALPLFEEALQRRKAVLGDDHPGTLTTMNNLAAAYADAGKPDTALLLLVEALKRTKLHVDHPDRLMLTNNVAVGYIAAGKPDLALPLLEKTLQRRKAVLGDDHHDTLTTMSNLAGVYRDAGKPDLALPLTEETLRLTKAKRGANHRDTLRCMNNLAFEYQAAGKLDLALPLLEETLRLMKVVQGDDHPETLACMSNLAMGYRDVGKHDLALPLLERAASGMEKLRFEHAFADAIVPNLADCYEHFKQFDRAEPWRRKWLAVVKERFGAESAPYADALAGLGQHLIVRQKWADAEPVLREALAFREKRQPDVWTTFNACSLLGVALAGQRKFAEAEPLLVRGYEGLKQRRDEIATPIRLTEALERLVLMYDATGQSQKAAAYRKELEEVKKNKS